MQDLIDYVLAQGWGLKFCDLGRRNGQYSNGLIKINDRRRTEWTQGQTLAHEIGHATHDHPWTDDPVVWARQEREADIVAARVLIARGRLADAVAATDGSAAAVAAWLGVREHYVNVYHETNPPTPTPPPGGRRLHVV